MNILGLCVGEFAAAALVSNGKLMGASYEERFYRKKCYAGFPARAIDSILHESNLSYADIDKVMVINETECGLELAVVQRLHSFGVADYLKEAHEYYYPMIFKNEKRKYMQVFPEKVQKGVFDDDIFDVLEREGETPENSVALRKELIGRHLGRKDIPIEFVEHHYSHALYGFLFAPRDSKKILVFTADSFGDYTNANIFRFCGGAIQKIYEDGTQNLGRLFRNITLLLGMKPYQHEYKVMGLAPYAPPWEGAKAKAVFDSYLSGFSDGEWKYARVPKDHYFTFREELEGIRFDAIAQGLQSHFEERMKEWFTYFIDRNLDCDTVVFSGGLSMNVKTNMLLSDIAADRGMRFCAAPSGDDYSHCVSVAFAGMLPSKESTGDLKAGHLDALDLGHLFSEADRHEIREWAERNGWAVRPVDHDAIAAELASGKILALCHGRAEFGARALGFRSIIADPRDADTIRRINVAVKMRDFWMPFAPAILDGHQTAYIEQSTCTEAYRFMACASRTTPEGRIALRAATHPYDSTARPQVVSSDANRLFATVIKHFGDRTGTYAVLNTSLNIHGYPIVNDAGDLIYLLENCGIDGCILEDAMMFRPEDPGE